MALVTKIYVYCVIQIYIKLVCGFRLEDHSKSESESCVVKSIQTFFSSKDDINFLYESNLRTYFIKNIANPLIIATADNYVNLMKTFSYNNYLIYVNDSSKLNITFNAFTNSKLWNPQESPRAQYIFVTYFVEEPKHIFEHLWQYHIRSAILILLNQNLHIAPTLYIWLPFSRENECGKNFIVNHFLDCNYNKAKRALEKRFEDFSKCTIGLISHNIKLLNFRYVLEASPAVAIVMNVVNLIGKILNARIVYYSNRDKKELKNVTNEILLDAVVYRPSKNQCAEYALSNTVYYDIDTWIAPRSGPIPNLEVIYFVFKNRTWCLIFFSILATGILWNLNSHQINGDQMYNQISQCILSVFSLVFAVPIKVLPRSICLRMLVAFYLIFIIHIDTAFQSKLSGILLIPSYEPPIDTMQKLADSNLKILLSEDLLEKFKLEETYNSSLSKKLHQKVEVLTSYNYTELIRNITRHKSFSTIVAKYMFINLFPNEVNRVHFIEKETEIIRFEVLTSMKNGHYFLPIFNSFLNRMIEGGFLFKGLPNFVIDFDVEDDNLAIVLRMEHLYGLIIIWSAGLCISLLIFLFELLIFYRHDLYLYFTNKIRLKVY